MAISKEMDIAPGEETIDFNDSDIFGKLKSEFENNDSDNDDDDDDETVEVNEDGEETVSQEQAAVDGIELTDDDNADNIPNAQIPRARFVEEKKKRQSVEAENEALKIQLEELKGNTQDKIFNDYFEAKKQKYITMGYDDDLATGLAEDLTENYKLTKVGAKAEEKENPVDKELFEIMKLKSESEYYDNADAFKDDIKSKMVKFGVTAKTAYNMIVEPETRQKELVQRQRAKGSLSDTTKSQTTVTSNAGAKRPETIQLNKKDLEVFNLLRAGDSSWTLERYKKRMQK